MDQASRELGIITGNASMAVSVFFLHECLKLDSLWKLNPCNGGIKANPKGYDTFVELLLAKRPVATNIPQSI